MLATPESGVVSAANWLCREGEAQQLQSGEATLTSLWMVGIMSYLPFY